MIKFREFGWIYAPASFAAWALLIAFVGFAAQVFVAVDSRSHSVSDTLYGIFPYWGVCFLLWNWVASRSIKSAR